MTEKWLKLKQKLDKSDKVYIFGAGFGGWRVYEHLRCYPYHILFCDNDKKKIGTKVYGLEVVDVQTAACDKGKIILIPHGRYEKEMCNQLLELSVDQDEYEICYKSLIPLKKTRIEIQVVDHCNLKCKGCNHLSSLATESFIDINELEKDYVRLNKIFNNSVERICLLGGEPLLHPNIDDICVLTRRFFKNANIAIITNGVLIRKQKHSFWDMCVDNNISVEITEYPINIPYSEIEEELNNKGVLVKTFSSISDFVHYPIDEAGEQNALESFMLCDRANTCILLSNHKLYPCAIPANIKYYNKTFGTSISEADDDGIEIFDDCNEDYIFSKLASPIQFCKYCDMKNIRTEKWAQSSLDRTEW